VINRGDIRCQRGTLAFQKFAMTSGSITVTGGGVIALSEAATLLGGLINGKDARFASPSLRLVGGTISAGTSPGTFTLDTNYEQGPDATMEIEIAGPTPDTEHDVLIVTGSAMLGGTLELHFLNGYMPPLGQKFQVLQCTNVSGQFDRILIFGLEPGKWVPPKVTAAGLELETVVDPRPWFLPPVFDGTNFKLSFGTVPGQTNFLESTESLEPPIIWQTEAEQIGDGMTAAFSFPVGGGRQRFFRVRQTQ
jgi:hypothetical protein